MSGKIGKKCKSQGKVMEFQNFLKRDGLWQCINVLKEFEKANSFPLKLDGFRFLRMF